jgi:hypothetical protein
MIYLIHYKNHPAQQWKKEWNNELILWID